MELQYIIACTSRVREQRTIYFLVEGKTKQPGKPEERRERERTPKALVDEPEYGVYRAF